MIWRRMHLVELEDLSWFPSAWRDAGTSFLQVASKLAGHSALLAPQVGDALKKSGQKRLIDLCAGGGGPIATVLEELEKGGMKVEGVVTDLFPNVPAMQRMEMEGKGRLKAWTQPVDATAVPGELAGLRVIFNAFHHFDRASAKAVLQDAVRSGQPIALYELVSREPFQLVALLFSPLTFMIALPMIRPFRLSWLFWTFVIPTIPAFIFWDAIVSWLRIWSAPELKELVAELDAPGWTWDIGTFKLGNAPANATYLIGIPPTN